MTVLLLLLRDTHIQPISTVGASVLNKVSSGLDKVAAEAGAPLFLRVG
jgi:hypothetical protein